MASTLTKVSNDAANTAADGATDGAADGGRKTQPAGALRRYGTALTTLKRRPEFQRLRGGTKWSGAAFLLEGKPRPQPPAGIPTGTNTAQAVITGIRFGFTITKKIGKAHERNRMRRRLSHALRSVAIPPELVTWDCVIVARKPAHDCPFDDLVRDFATALKRLARSTTPSPQPNRDAITAKPPPRSA